MPIDGKMDDVSFVLKDFASELLARHRDSRNRYHVIRKLAPDCLEEWTGCLHLTY